MIEPSIKKSLDDHESVAELKISYEKLKMKFDDFEYTTSKTLNKLVTADDLIKKQQEIVRKICLKLQEKGRIMSEEKMWSEFS